MSSNPTTKEVFSRERLLNRLEDLEAMFGYWLKFNKDQRDRENLPTSEDTHVLSVPPHWPTHGTIREWCLTLNAAAEIVRAGTEAGVVQATFWTCSNCNADNNRDDYHRISCPHCGKLRPPVEPPAAHEWLAVDGSIPSPDFQVWGFHTGKQVEYRTENGTEHVGPYQGYGLFGPNLEATHWRPVTKGDR